MEHVIKRIAADTASKGHGFISLAEYQGAAKYFNAPANQLFSINQAVTNDVGDVAVKLAETGQKLHASFLASSSTGTAAVAPGERKYAIETNIPIPDKIDRRGSGLIPRKSEYPLDEMPVGASISVMKRDENDDPIRRMGSIVSAANRRLHPRQFRVFDHETVPGAARVFRLPDTTQPLAPPRPRQKKTPEATHVAGATQSPPAGSASGFQGNAAFGGDPSPAPAFGQADFGSAGGFGSGGGETFHAPAGFGFGQEDGEV